MVRLKHPKERSISLTIVAIEGMNASGGGNKADQAEPSVAGQKN